MVGQKSRLGPFDATPYLSTILQNGVGAYWKFIYNVDGWELLETNFTDKCSVCDENQPENLVLGLNLTVIDISAFLTMIVDFSENWTIFVFFFVLFWVSSVYHYYIQAVTMFLPVS